MNDLQLSPDELEIDAVCQALVNYDTNDRCNEIATIDDDSFRYPMCDKHAQIAYACIDADDQMLQNAY